MLESVTHSDLTGFGLEPRMQDGPCDKGDFFSLANISEMFLRTVDFLTQPVAGN